MKGRLAPAVLLLLALLVPLGTAAPASVDLQAMGGGIWNGESAAEGPFELAMVRLWVPQGARIQQVVAEANGEERSLTWRASGPESVELALPDNATRAVVRFDFRASPPILAGYLAPERVERLVLSIAPPEGYVIESDATTFTLRDGAYVATLQGMPEGTRVPLRVVDAGRVGEVSVLASVIALGALGLAGGILYHRIRPPNQGRAPERFLDHLSELQARIMPPVVLFVALNLVYFTMGLRVATRRGFQVIEPVVGIGASLSARAFDAFAERLVPAGVQLIVTRPIDAVLAQVETALFLAFLSTLPLLLYEVGAFLGPALLEQERRIATRTLPLVSLLFLGGALFGLLLMAPLMIRTLYSYAPGLGAAPFLVVGELVSFALLVLLVFGFAFELPVLMYVLARLGVVRAASFRRYWRHAVVGIVLLGGLLTPDPSVVTQAFVSLPLLVLYGIGVLASGWGERARPAS